MPLLHLLFFALTACLFFFVPGALVARLMGRGRFEDAAGAVAFCGGMVLIPFLAFLAVGLAGLSFRVYLTWHVLAGTALVVGAAAAAGIRYLEGDFKFFKEIFWSAPTTRFSIPLVLFLALVLIVYLVGYDSILFDQERCIIRAGTLPCFDYLTTDPPVGFDGCVECFSRRNAFLLWNGGQRMGPSVFVSSFMALFGFPGFRILHALLGLMTAWMGFHLGASVFGRNWAGYAVAALLALNPYALSVPLLDENTMSLALGTGVFYFLLRKRSNPQGFGEADPDFIYAGLFLGLFLGIRHIGLLSLPAVALLVMRRGTVGYDWWRSSAAYLGQGRVAAGLLAAGSTVFFCIPWIIVHTAFLHAGADGGGFRFQDVYESLYTKPPMPHSFLGIEFEFRGLLSWPFVDQPVRSPYNGFPTLVAFPLAILHSWGALLLALVPVGILWAARRGRDGMIFAALWLLPQLAMLMTMSNWVQPNKMGVFLCFSQPIALGMVAGMVGLVDAVRKRQGAMSRVVAGAVGVCFATLLLGLPAMIRDYDAPLDERMWQGRVEYITRDYTVTPPILKTVEKGYADKDRERLSRVAVLPAFSMARRLYRPALLRVLFARLWADLGHCSFKDYCERPKDIIHTLSAFETPPDLREDPGARLSRRTAKSKRMARQKTAQTTITMAHMQQHPISHLKIALGGIFEACAPSEAPDGSKTELMVLDLDHPPNDEEFFMPAREGPQWKKWTKLSDKIVISPNNEVTWADGFPCHWVIIPVGDREYWMTLWYGDYLFDFLADREDVVVAETDKPLNYLLEVPLCSVIRVADATTIEPTRFHTWTLHVTGSERGPFGPIPSSY